MKYTNEGEVLKALGIESFRNLSKDKLMAFASTIPDMDKEVALKIVEQIPEFKDFALQIISDMQQGYQAALNSNDLSQQRFHDAMKETREMLLRELDRDLTPEERDRVYEFWFKLLTMESEKDSENKRFLDSQFGKFVALGTVGLVSLVVAFSGKVAIQSRGD